MQKEIAQLFFVSPMECKEVGHVRQIPQGADWQYEVKFDGYRCLATVRKGDVSLYSRNGKVFSQFPNVEEALRKLRAKSFVVDGELVALDANGRSDFNALQRVRRSAVDVHFYLFDLLHLNGKDLTNLPLEKRQALLQETFANPPGTIHFSTPLAGDLSSILEKIQEFGFEGIVAKKKDSPYLSGKASGFWVKKKLKQTAEFVIGGYVPGPRGVASILVGLYAGDQLMFVQNVDDGFVPRARRQVLEAIEKLQIDQCPFANLPEKSARNRWGGKSWDEARMRTARWVKPKIIVEIAMNEWTPDGHLRHSEFRRLRPDKTLKHLEPFPTTS